MAAEFRHSGDHELREELSRPGCAVCRLASRAVAGYLDGFDWELINDVGVRERLRRSYGFCPRHTRELGERASRLALAIVAEDFLRQAEALLEGWSRRPPRSAVPCPACEVYREQEETSLAALDLTGEEMLAAYRASTGLCLPHVVAACRRLREPARRRLVEIERERLRSLAGELAEVRRKHDYRAIGEAWGSEKDAPDRAVRKLAGEGDP